MNWCENISLCMQKKMKKKNQQFQKVHYKSVYFWEETETLEK